MRIMYKKVENDVGIKRPYSCLRLYDKNYDIETAKET